MDVVERYFRPTKISITILYSEVRPALLLPCIFAKSRRPCSLQQIYRIFSYFIMEISSKKMAELVKNIEIELGNSFTEHELNQLARESKFVQRISDLDGFSFFDLVVFCSDNLADQSLNDLTIDAKERHGIEIKKQSLHERFNEKAVLMLQNAMEKLINDQHETQLFQLRKIEGFNRILIKDSTCFQLHESLARHYPGSGGSGSKAMVRIQFEFDILTGKITDLSINAFNDQDATNSIDTIELTQNGDLIIRDLAYINLKVIKLIEQRDSYYLGRLAPNMNVYEPHEKAGKAKLSFEKIRDYMRNNNIEIMEKDVCIGATERIRSRLIIHLIPQQHVEKRIRKAKKNNKKKSRNELSKEYLSWLHLNLFITNSDEKKLSAEAVWPLYTLRWQIELVFKIWKSYFGIEKVKKVNKYRLECYLYSKLIVILLGWKILWNIAKHMLKYEGLALSFMKAFKRFGREKISQLRQILILNTRSLEKFVEDFYPICTTKLLLEKRKGSQTSLEILMGI